MKQIGSITSRAHPLWLAYIVHRLSGLALVLFLPVHFWVLSKAVSDPNRLDSLLAFTESASSLRRCPGSPHRGWRVRPSHHNQT